jgi:hypothetical protein
MCTVEVNFPFSPPVLSTATRQRRIDVIITLPRIGSSLPLSTFTRVFPSIYPLLHHRLHMGFPAVLYYHRTFY